MIILKKNLSYTNYLDLLQAIFVQVKTENKATLSLNPYVAKNHQLPVFKVSILYNNKNNNISTNIFIYASFSPYNNKVKYGHFF